MTIIQSILLGIVQGLTEFLPVSSSAHLVLVPYFLGWRIQQYQIFPFDVLVQVASLCAVILYFRSELFLIGKAFFRGLMNKTSFQDLNSKLGWYMIIATIPSGALGLLLKNSIEKTFSTPKLTGIFLLGTALILVVAEQLGKRNRFIEEVKWMDALWVGFFQALALFPGISRSGATITGGMIRNLKRADAARFSFLISIPIMFSAGIIAAIDLVHLSGWRQFLPGYLPGLLASLIVSYAAIHWFLGYLKKHRLYIFAIYCLLLGILVIFS